MLANITHKDHSFTVDLAAPLDISIPIKAGTNTVSAWYVDPVKIEPVQGEGFVGDVNQGGSVNFRNIAFNPHGHGTHTECVGHISKEYFSINRSLKQFFFPAQLITVMPEVHDIDRIITLAQIKDLFTWKVAEAVVIRTLPNSDEKLSMYYSNTNPPFIEYQAVEFLVNNGINHLLIDLPSVDREEDGGRLLAHKAFWNYPEKPELTRTITEFIYVPEFIPDGKYLLNLQIASFENDAAPSKPVLYAIS